MFTCVKMNSSNQRNADEMELLTKAGYKHVKGTLMPQPISRPKFTLTELRNAIPAHCFERSMVKSFGYLTIDFVIVFLLLCSAYAMLERQFLPLYFQITGYSAYWFIQGSFFFAIWVLGHECGEFSKMFLFVRISLRDLCLTLQDMVHFLTTVT